MCGIVSAISQRNVVPLLLDGLKRLEYRGYDSAGVAVINGKLHRARSVGRVMALEKMTDALALSGSIGIAHTRWATHGAPSERNAHPHNSSGVSVVHNGIIENFSQIRFQLSRQGYEFVSETDTEVIAHLVHSRLKNGVTLLDAVRQTTTYLIGSYAIAVIHEANPTRLVVARHGAPLLLGLGEGENFAASDPAALIRMTNRLIYLEDGDCAEITLEGASITDLHGNAAQREIRLSQLSDSAIELGTYRHFMHKEIFEQPLALAATLAEATSASEASSLSPTLFGSGAEVLLRNTRQIMILACGTSYHAGMVARYWLESIAGIPCNVEIASEYRYREMPVLPDTLIVTLSQSGETADTLAALHYARSLVQRTHLCICNVAESSLIRAADLCFITRAGPEIGVASTKAFTTQLAALGLLTLVIAKLRGALPASREAELLDEMRQLPTAVHTVLQLESKIEQWAKRLVGHEHALFLGRGVHYPIAMEGALKLKEISYIHAEAYAAGELKHGPLALVTAAMPVIAIAAKDRLLEKLESNLQEVKARGGELYVIADHGTEIDASDGMNVLHMPHMPHQGGLFSPILHTLPLQLLAYHVALLRNNDIDKPRNLAKSVTVE